MPWLLMSRILASSANQQLWYWVFNMRYILYPGLLWRIFKLPAIMGSLNTHPPHNIPHHHTPPPPPPPSSTPPPPPPPPPPRPPSPRSLCSTSCNIKELFHRKIIWKAEYVTHWVFMYVKIHKDCWIIPLHYTIQLHQTYVPTVI